MSMTITEMSSLELETLVARDRNDREIFALTSSDISSLERYVHQRIQPGGFLTAVLSNDLKEALGRADTYNRRKLFEYVGWLYNNAPRACWGTPERVVAWLNPDLNTNPETELEF